MSDSLAMALGWSVVAIAFFSYLGVQAWVEAQRRERETYYRAEAIKKVAEMQGSASDAVIDVLREALKPPVTPPNPWTVNPSVMRDYYRNETMRRMAESRGGDGAENVLALMREEELRSARRVREGLKLGGLIVTGAGAGLFIFLQAMFPEMPVYLAGLIPGFVGVAMLIYVLFLSPRA